MDDSEHKFNKKTQLRPESLILKLFKLAVSLGGTESLAKHPASMTHAELDSQERIEMGITEKMVRLSIGVEHPHDLILDLEQALDEA